MRCKPIFLTLLALALFPVLILAQGSSATSGEMTPLLQAIETAVQGPPIGEPEVSRPLEMNHCNAQQTCPTNQCFISCTGHVSCTVASASVTCDNVTTGCPYPGCTPPTVCIDPCGYCACKANFGSGCMKNCTTP